MAYIHVHNLDIDFPIYHGDAQSLKKNTADLLFKLSGRIMQEKKDRFVVKGLRNISFAIEKSERVGLVGRNGAGKTTLLRAMSGIFEPVQGRITIQGKISSLLDSNMGMNSELTGRENIQLRCLYNGLNAQETGKIIKDVEAFAELGAFIDLPIKTYSSGMNLRLGFALATAIDPSILLMDEWLMAGDSSFLNKAKQRIENMVNKADIMVISTHQPDIIRKWCTRALWIEEGHLKMDASPSDVLNAYLAY